MLEKTRLLILDDDANQRKTLADALLLEGLHADGFGSGNKGLEKAKLENYAAALIDLKLADMSGLEAIRALKQQTPDIECILLTGYASQESAIDAINLGVFAYFQKPYSTEQLILAVKRAIEKKNSAESLRSNQAALSALINAVNQSIMLLELDGTIVAINEKSALLMKESIDNLIGKNIFDFFTEGDIKLDKQTAEQVIKTGKPIVFETTQFKRIFETTIYPVKHESGDVYRLAFVGDDITERKKSETLLRENEELLRYLLKHDPNAIAVYDNNLHYIAVSDRYLKDYNVKEEDIIGRHHYEIFPEMPQKWKDVHSRCLAGAIERNDDDYFERPDGTITYNRWECRPWYRSDGKIGGITTYTEVTTERKKYEQEITTPHGTDFNNK